jgi:ATP-dependent Clp protease ATP-binding subunit ClpA
MIGRKTEAVLNRAVGFALENDHEYFTLEHVLWALLAEPSVSETLKSCGADIGRLRRALEAFLLKEIPTLPKRGGGEARKEQATAGEAPAAQSQEGDESDTGAEHPVATLSIQRLIQRALFHVQSAGKDEIQPVDLLVALFQAKDSQALKLLDEEGVSRLDVLNFVSHGIRKADPSAPEGSGPVPEQGPEHESLGETLREAAGEKGSVAASASEDPLQLFCSNLNERARQGKLDPLIGRQTELERLIQTLCRRRKNNPLLVGEAGVGKTAIAEGLASRIVEGEVPAPLKDAVLYALDMGSLLAGTKFRGDFEQRLKRVFSALEKKRAAGVMPILLIDEIHTVVGAGAVSGGSMDAANLLKPLLSQGEIRCIGSTTYQEYRAVFEKDHALARRFQKIDVAEPSVEDTVQILEGLKSRFEEHHGVSYTAEAIRSAVELSAKHLTERFLPDKAIDVIDEAGARLRLRRGAAGQKAQDKDAQDEDAGTGARVAAGPERLDSSAIEEVIAQIARIPARSVTHDQKQGLKNLERDLKLTIFGQDPAIEALVTAIRLARSGLSSGERPVGSFLFCGPTGVGKTELSKQLARCLGVPFLRFDMSEYSERHTISRLIGAPPGYVGFEQSGLLTDAVLKSPHSVVLLDEVEKAHPEIWNILLQIMDHGTLTDNNGRKADFRNGVLILTSNVGSREIERRPLGLGISTAELKGSTARREVERTFNPEFRNRLDAIVYFDPLDPVTVGQIVGKNLLELEGQLLAKGVELEAPPEVREWLAQKGYEPTMGARPMRRLIEDRIKKPLANEILFGRLESGGSVRLGLKAEEVVFEITPAGPPGAAPAQTPAADPAPAPESVPAAPGTRS